jgi:hypothetical protein
MALSEGLFSEVVRLYFVPPVNRRHPVMQQSENRTFIRKSFGKAMMKIGNQMDTPGL